MPATHNGRRRNVVLFDGVCVLCDRSMRFLLAKDDGEVLSFAPLQGETARQILARHPKADRSLATVLYAREVDTENEMVYERSDAALMILRDLGGIWRALSWLRWIPRAIRDGIYGVIARNRYRWFGKLDACQLPGSDESHRFLD
ncbi:MAG TPA: DCC1-like thiol-disulfide oxidoreductase family protein [Vicinamibacteria bacterium]|nr:DCC1-like thiol-disulfide oxidoreductase family protein [Vicinamibacteria bacterium]